MTARPRSNGRIPLTVLAPAKTIRILKTVARRECRDMSAQALMFIEAGLRLARGSRSADGGVPVGAGGGCPKGGDAEDGGDDDPRP